MKRFLFPILLATSLSAHDSRGRSIAPIESRRLKNPVEVSEGHLFFASFTYTRLCVSCHGADGKSRTKIAGTLPYRPTDLTNYLMQSMKDGEIFWILGNGIPDRMPSFASQLTEAQRWEMVLWVRELRVRQLHAERIQLGTYQWQLPPGFPHPKVPSENLMTAEKVELGRHLFYDRRLSLNRTQSCATCHKQSQAFTDSRAVGVGSTGEHHPRGPMSLVNAAYSPALTWANPNLGKLEQQILVPLFGEHPVELGMAGKESVLIERIKAEPRYQKLFPAAFPSEADAFSVLNVTRAIACFERTLLAGDSPYDEYRRGDDPEAISASAKRGEALFFSERTECFHCHGGFNFTGTIDYLGKATPEIEFHNTGLYNLKGRLNYPADNTGLYEFTQHTEDVGRFKAPSLRNIALTAPYMHDGSIKTLEAAIEHYSSGGRSIKAGPFSGIGAGNPNKSEFVKPFSLSYDERRDLLAFLRSLTDPTIANRPEWSDPWGAVSRTRKYTSRFTVRGRVLAIFAEDSSLSLSHEVVPGLLAATKSREFLVADQRDIATLRPGVKITAGVRKRGNDYVLQQIKSEAKP